MTTPNIRLWTVYLNYIRRRNDLSNDPNGHARQTVAQSYEFVIDNIGVDRDSGAIWQDYLQFIRNEFMLSRTNILHSNVIRDLCVFSRHYASEDVLMLSRTYLWSQTVTNLKKLDSFHALGFYNRPRRHGMSCS